MFVKFVMLIRATRIVLQCSELAFPVCVIIVLCLPVMPLFDLVPACVILASLCDLCDGWAGELGGGVRAPRLVATSRQSPLDRGGTHQHHHGHHTLTTIIVKQIHQNLHLAPHKPLYHYKVTASEMHVAPQISQTLCGANNKAWL